MNTFGEENENDQKLQDGVGKGVTRRQFLGLAGGAAAAVALGGGAAGLLAGCSSTPTTTSTTAATTGSTGVATPKYGGTMRISAPTFGVNVGWPAGLAGGGVFVESYYETLIRSDEKGDIVPWLAESAKVAEDKKSITFTLRKGIKFHDGSDLTADVVKWNLEQYAPAQANWGAIEVVDPSTVRVAFKTWDNSNPHTFGDAAVARAYIVSKAAFDKNGGKDWMTSHPVGTGPFTFVNYVTDSSMKLVKNPNYWAKDKNGGKLPYLDGLAFSFVSDATTQEMMAKAGELDMVTAISPGKALEDYRKMGWKTHASAEANQVWVPDSAHADSPWSKLEVREAAEYSVDRVTIAKKFGYGDLVATLQIPPRDTTAWDKNYASARNYDPAKAKQLLAQAGYANGFKTTVYAWQGSKDIALANQQYLQAVGIQADYQFVNAGKWDSLIGPAGSFHNAMIEGPDPSQGPSGLGAVSFAKFLYGNSIEKPADLTAAIDAAAATLTPEVSLVRKATDLIAKDAILIPLYEIGSGRAEQNYVFADFGKRGIPTFSLESTWMSK